MNERGEDISQIRGGVEGGNTEKGTSKSFKRDEETSHAKSRNAALYIVRAPVA